MSPCLSHTSLIFSLKRSGKVVFGSLDHRAFNSIFALNCKTGPTMYIIKNKQFANFN